MARDELGNDPGVTGKTLPSPALGGAGDLGALWSERAAHYADAHRQIDRLVDVYYGKLPAEFDDYFHPEMHVHIVNMIRLAWDDLATMAGKEFPIYVEADNDSPTAKERAEKQEKIAYGYNRAGRITGGIHMKMLMKILMWWLVGTANAVLMVLPSYEFKTPFFTFRDPRTHYPPVGWTPFTQAAAKDSLFAYQMTIGAVKKQWGHEDEISQKIQRKTIGPSGKTVELDDSTYIWVGEYYEKDTWMVSTLEPKAVTLQRSDDGDKGHPGIQPASAMSLYVPSNAKGYSLFADQVSIQAAMARMFSQKLDFFDRTLYPLIFHTPLSGQTIKVGPYATNEYNVTSGTTPKVDTVAPAHQIDADQTMAFALQLSRMLNRNPEQMQGQGEADSAKALTELKSGITATVRDWIWPPALEVLPTVYANAATTDVNVWGNVKKQTRGRRRGAAFAADYVPTTVLRGRENDFEIEPGLGLAGYQGTLELMQLLGAKMIPVKDALEQGEWVRNVQEALRGIQSDKLEELLFADLATKAQGMMLQPNALSEVRKRVNKGEDLFDVVSDLAVKGQLVVPPAPVAPAGPGAGPEGMQAAAGMTPTLDLMRSRMKQP